MKSEYEISIITAFIFIFAFIFGVISYLQNNLEFVYGAGFTAITLFVLLKYHKKLHLTIPIFVSLGILVALHLIGGFVTYGGVRLYDLTFTLFRYDNLVHFFGAIVFTFIGYNFLRPYLDRELKHKPLLLAVVLILIALGIGATCELYEFSLVMGRFGAPNVGGYFNTMFDLVFDALGALTGTIALVYYHGVYVVKKK